MSLSLCPVSRSEASAFVRRFHRHHKPAVGDVFRVAAHDGTEIVGVATVGRPVARMLDDGRTLEINRLCVEEGTGTPRVYSWGPVAGPPGRWGTGASSRTRSSPRAAPRCARRATRSSASGPTRTGTARGAPGSRSTTARNCFGR